MNINKMKNFVIMILVITAVYQTGLLWLEDIASHNFFYTVFGIGGQKEVIATEGELLLPGKVMIGGGNKKYTIIYTSEIGNHPILSQSNDLLKELLSQGTIKGTQQEIPWEDILARKCVLLDYGFLVPSEGYFREERSKVSVPGLEYFDFVAILPGRTGGETTKAYFIHIKENQYWEVALEKSRIADMLYQALEPVETELNYVSAKQSGFNLFTETVFVPQWRGKSLPYRNVRQWNPFLQDGSINRYLLENSVDGFFKNLSADWNDIDETGIYVFSDETVVVKYDPKGVLEYYSYGIYDPEVTTDIVTGFQLCKNFMKNDKSLETDVYLSGIQENRNETIFYFDYTVDQYPVLLSEGIQKEVGFSHAIEISVRGNSVRKYRRYAYNFKPTETADKNITIEFLTALDQAILQYQQNHPEEKVKEVENMYLGYFVEPNNTVSMKWMTELYEEVYIGNTVAAEE